MKLSLKLILIPAEGLVLVVSDSEWRKLEKQGRLVDVFFHEINCVVTSVQSKSFQQNMRRLQ